jgi:hypothetical protein
MGNLFDDAARILASPLPRRQALTAIGRILAGSILAAFGVRRADSQAAEPLNSSTCRPACTAGQRCCTTSTPGFCVAASRVCCGKSSCPTGNACCVATNGTTFCSGVGRTCCGNTSCAVGSACCTGTTGQKFCAGLGRVCCGNTSCGALEQCCRTGSQPFCAVRGATCCGNTSCPQTEVCCGRTVCCGTNQKCLSGRCEVSKS